MSRKKILIIDDEKDLLRTMNILLQAKGFDVVVAEDGVSAISVAKTEKPDLILLDIGLPAGDGLSVIERFKKLASMTLTPIIVVTGRDPSNYKEKALQAGAKAFFQKPINSKELLKTINEMLETPVDVSQISEIG